MKPSPYAAAHGRRIHVSPGMPGPRPSRGPPGTTAPRPGALAPPNLAGPAQRSPCHEHRAAHQDYCHHGRRTSRRRTTHPGSTHAFRPTGGPGTEGAGGAGRLAGWNLRLSDCTAGIHRTPGLVRPGGVHAAAVRARGFPRGAGGRRDRTGRSPAVRTRGGHDLQLRVHLRRVRHRLCPGPPIWHVPHSKVRPAAPGGEITERDPQPPLHPRLLPGDPPATGPGRRPVLPPLHHGHASAHLRADHPAVQALGDPGLQPRRIRPGGPPAIPDRSRMSRNTHVLLYRGLARLATQSGIGEAIRHQQRTLALTGRTVTSQVFGQWDVVHLNTVFPDTPLLVLLARLRRRRVVLWAHSTEEDFRNSFRGSNLLSPLFRRWITLLYRMGDVVITPTAYSHELIRSYGLPGRVRVLSNGVDTQFFTPDDGAGRDFRRRHGIAQDAQLVVSAGLQIARKGILDWIELARSRPEMQFWWFGHTAPVLLDPAVRTAMQGAPDNCVFPGYVPAAELRDAYRAADVFAFLTHEETEGLVLLEALACGAPVLLRDIPLYA